MVEVLLSGLLPVAAKKEYFTKKIRKLDERKIKDHLISMLWPLIRTEAFTISSSIVVYFYLISFYLAPLRMLSLYQILP